MPRARRLDGSAEGAAELVAGEGLLFLEIEGIAGLAGGAPVVFESAAVGAVGTGAGDDGDLGAGLAEFGGGDAGGNVEFADDVDGNGDGGAALIDVVIGDAVDEIVVGECAIAVDGDAAEIATVAAIGVIGGSADEEDKLVEVSGVEGGVLIWRRSMVEETEEDSSRILASLTSICWVSWETGRVS